MIGVGASRCMARTTELRPANGVGVNGYFRWV
jgi:hypothetical protein